MKKLLIIILILNICLICSFNSFAYFMPKSTLNIYIDNVYQETVQLNNSGERQWYLAINYSNGYTENGNNYGYLRGFGLTGSTNSPTLNISIDSTKYPLINCSYSFVKNTTRQMSTYSYTTHYSVGTNINEFDIMLYTKEFCQHNDFILVKTCVNEVKREFMCIPINVTYNDYYDYLNQFNNSSDYFYNYMNITDMRYSTDSYTFNDNLAAAIKYCGENNAPLYLEYKYNGSYSYPRLPVHPYTDTVVAPEPVDTRPIFNITEFTENLTNTLKALPRLIIDDLEYYILFISGLLIIGIVLKYIGGNKDV